MTLNEVFVFSFFKNHKYYDGVADQWSVVGDHCQFWTNDHLMVGKSEQCED